MTVAPVTNQVDNDVFFKLLPIRQRQASDKDNRFRIIAVPIA